MDLTIVLAAACAALILALLAVAWLHWRPRLNFSVYFPTPAPERPVPTHVKCNTKHFIFTRTNPETGEPEQCDVWRHPYCENLPNDALTDAVQGANFLDGRVGQGWTHAETRGEMHMVKL